MSTESTVNQYIRLTACGPCTCSIVRRGQQEDHTQPRADKLPQHKQSQNIGNYYVQFYYLYTTPKLITCQFGLANCWLTPDGLK